MVDAITSGDRTRTHFGGKAAWIDASLRRAKRFPGEATKSAVAGHGPHPIGAQRSHQIEIGSGLPSAVGISKAFIVMQMSV
jgi:hypothetical protein